MQKCVYGIADASRHSYLHVRGELVRSAGKLRSVDPGIFYWQDNSGLIGILACHVDVVTWGGTQYFKTNIIDNLKSTFKFGSEETETFVYIGIKLTQSSDYSICVEQNNYTASISEISLPKERMSDHSSPLTEAERRQYRSAAGQLNRVDGISRPDISFCLQGQYKVQKCNSSRCILCQQNYQKCKELQKLH